MRTLLDGLEQSSDWLTLRESGATALSVPFVPLPAAGIGYYSYVGQPRRYGRAEAISAIQAIAAAWLRNHPSGPRIGVGDISFAGGGRMPPHVSHQAGLDVDIRPVRGDGREGPTTYRLPTYSRQLTQELVNIVLGNGVLHVQSILFNDPAVGGVRAWRGHDNHLHVRFRPALINAPRWPPAPPRYPWSSPYGGPLYRPWNAPPSVAAV